MYNKAISFLILTIFTGLIFVVGIQVGANREVERVTAYERAWCKVHVMNAKTGAAIETMKYNTCRAQLLSCGCNGK